jgi:Zn-dependent peptidase ImmA (M78 family)
MKIEVEVNKDILLWAIKRAGSNIPSISKVFPKFESWLKGDKKPTLKQLEKFSKKVHVPFGFLLLDNIPKEYIPIPYFRNKTKEKISLNVYETILLLQQRQEWLREYLIDNNESPLPFVGVNANSVSINEIVKSIRDIFNLNENWAKEFPTWEKALTHFIEQVEKTNIVIVFNSIVGNNTSRKIEVDECRGFVLVDKYVPFLFVNSGDAKAAQMFTIAHEIAHILIGKSAGFDLADLLPYNEKTEVLCNKVAAEFLVPAKRLKLEWNSMGKNFQILAKQFKVSELVIARRAYDLKLINKNDFFDFYNKYLKTVKRSKKSWGGGFYKTQKRRLGDLFPFYLSKALQENRLLYRDAWNLTGLKGKTFDKFMNGII